MYRNSRVTLPAILFLASILFLCGELSVHAQNGVNSIQPRPAVSILDSTKEQDGLVGSVRRIKIEAAKIEDKEGRAAEGPRQLLELTTYGIKGNRIENISYPIPDSLVGKEEYKYDQRGNIVEMTLRDDQGLIINREAYTYEFDSFGNWTKMVTSLVLFENGELKKEPVEVTYRTLTYYFDDSIAKIVDPAPPTAAANVPAPAEFRPATFEPVKSNVRAPEGDVTAAALKSAGEPPPSAAATEPKKARLITTIKPNTHETITMRSVPAPVNDGASTPATSSTPGRTSSYLKAKMNETLPATTEAEKPDEKASPPATISPSSKTTADADAMANANAIRQRTAYEYYQAGLAKFAAGDLKAALGSYLESIKLEPKSAEVQLNLGLTYLRLEKDKDAAKAFGESVKLNPESPEAHYGLGLSYFRMHRFRDAANSFKKAVAISPNMAKAHYGLSLAYEELNEHNAVLDEFRILERLDKELAKKLMQTFPQIPFTCRYTQLCQ